MTPSAFDECSPSAGGWLRGGHHGGVAARPGQRSAGAVALCRGGRGGGQCGLGSARREPRPAFFVAARSPRRRLAPPADCPGVTETQRPNEEVRNSRTGVGGGRLSCVPHSISEPLCRRGWDCWARQVLPYQRTVTESRRRKGPMRKSGTQEPRSRISGLPVSHIPMPTKPTI